eukprot:1194402-Prorocentrum_minimum.AAC.3
MPMNASAPPCATGTPVGSPRCAAASGISPPTFAPRGSTCSHVSTAGADSSPGVDCRPASGSMSPGNIRRIFDGIFEMPRAEWYTSVNCRLLN